MPNRDFVRSFSSDGLHFDMIVTRDHQVVFQLTGGRFKDGQQVTFYDDSFYYNASEYSVSGNLVKNPLRVVREFMRLLCEYLYEYKPPYVWFHSFEDNRARVYRKLMKKLPPMYEVVNYGPGDRTTMALRKAERETL